ncbi:hypothetical protein CGMCC3_g17389 [Colletotrichum fructicola]|nr:uncharacterized protein CGMCC3_g17389 [Colletotrichum fructicola]KAE9566466.1 hypothetical protein CGMCC3_g17389 [Colletotrichum fructicola]
MVRGAEALLELLALQQLPHCERRAADVATLVGGLPQADGDRVLQTGHAKLHLQAKMAIRKGRRARREVGHHLVVTDAEVSLASGELPHELFQTARAGSQPASYVCTALVPPVGKQAPQWRQAFEGATVVPLRIVEAGQAVQRRFGAVELDIEAEELT